ncbi:TPA: hypothetical protein ACH3X2_000688 [Trebouxia sp. C0005]
MVQIARCLVDLANANLATATASFKTLLRIFLSANGYKELEQQVQDTDEHQASAIMRTLLQAPEGGPSRSSKQAVRAIRLIGVMVANKSFVSKLQVEEQSKVLKFLLHRLHTTKAQAEAASIYWCLSRQHLFPQVLHQSAGELAVAINFGIPSSNEWKILRIVLACLSQLFDQIAADFSAKADLWLPSLWRLLLVQPKAPYTKEDRKKWAALRQQARETFTQVWSRHDSSLSELSEQIQKELLLELLGAPAESLPAGSHGLLSIMTAWTSACWDSGYAEKGTLQELSTEEREALAVDAIQAWCCFLNLLGAAFLTPGAAVGQAMIQVVCDVLIRSGSLVLLKAAVMAWKKLADTVINAGQLSMRQELVKPVIYMLKTCHTPAAYQAALGLWKHMVQLASKVTTGEDPASKAATWTLIADCSSPVLLALAAMPPGMCDTAGPGQDVVASSAVSQAIEWLVTSGPGEGILITLLHKVAKKCSGPAGRKAQQSANKPIQDAHKLVLTALVGETSRLMSHCSGRNTHGIQRVLLQTVANADCNGLHEANYEPWQKLCDDLNMCKQLEVQQHFLLHIITEALAHKEASRHQAALAMWNYLLQLVCPNPGKASTTQRSLFVSFAAPMLLVLAAMPSEGLDQVQPLWLQVLDRWLDMWPHIWMLAALMSKLRQQIGIDSSVIMSQAGAQPSGIVQMQLLATILQKMCCIMAELYRSDSPAGLRSFIQYHKSAEELYSELCHQMVALPAQDEGAEGASTHVLNALGSCFMLMCSASMQAFMSDDQSNMLYHMLPSTVAMLGSCTELIKAAPPHGHVKILLPDDIKMPLKALLPREWSRVCSMYWLVLSTGDPQLAYQTRWQPGHASIRAELSSSVYLPMTLDVCSALMRAITTYMLAVDAFAESAEEMTAAVAFAAQVLQIPLEFVKQSVAAGGISIVTEMSAGPESDVAERPEGPSKDEGQDARGTAGASKEVHADMGEGAVELSGQDVVSWYMPWQDLYLVVAQVARRSQACAADHTAALATYLLSFAAAMRQSNVDKVTPMSPSTMSGFGLATPAASLQPQRPLLQNAAAASMPLWTCFLAADASVIVKQACRDSPAPAAEAHRPVCLAALCIKLLETSLEHVCHAALASPGIGMGYLSALLDAVPDACASFADTQPLMTAVAACIQLADHVTDRRTTLQLEAAWKAVIAAFNPRSMLQLSQVSIDELFLQPMATALKYGSQAMRDMTQEFWGNSGIGSVLSAFDVSIVESALAPPEHPSNLVQLALRKAMSAGILTTMSAMTAMSDSGSLEIEMDADPADAPHTADAMAEGDSVDAIANVALAPAQAKAVVKTQVQLAAVSMDKMARTSCGHATRPMPANQARTAEVKAVHTKRVTFAATSPNKAATSHVATAVTGAKQVQRRRARGVMVNMLRRRQEAKQLQQQQQQQQQHQMQASVMHQQLASPSDLPPTNSARIEVGSNSQLIPNTQTHGDVDHSTPSDRTGEASGSHQQPREEDASSSQADQVSRQHTDNRWKGRTRGTARKDSCLDEQPVESVKVASESHTALDSEPLPSQRIAKGKGRFKHRTQGKKKKRGEGSGAGESRKHDKKLSSQAHAQSKRCKTRHHRKQRVTELGSLGDVEPVKDSGEHVDQACLGQHHPQRCSKPVAPVAGLQRLCKLLPNSGPLKSKLSEAKEEMSRAVEATSQNLSRLPSKPGQAAHAFAGTASLPSSAHHIGHGAQAAQGAEAMQEQAQLHVTSFESVHGSALHMPAIASKGSTKGGLRRLPGTLTKTKQATPVTDLQHEIQPADCITSAAHALSKRDQSIQPDGSKLQGQPRRCEQAGCSIPVGTEVQAPGTQPQAQEEPRLQSSSPKCLHDQITVDQPSQAVLAVVTGHEGPYLPNQACLHSTSEPDNCDKRPAEYSPQAREVACKRTRESMHDDSLEKQNVPTQGTYDTELAEADLQDFGEAHLSLLQASLPVDGLIGQGRQKATEEVASGRSSAAAHSTDVHDSPGLYLGLDNEHQVLEDTHSGTVATVKVGSLVASSVATTEVVQATAVQHEYVSTAQSARPEQDACFSEMPSKSLGLTPVDAVVNRDQINRDILGQSVTALSTGDQQGRIAPDRARPASSSSAGPASRQASLAVKRHAECSADAEMSALKKARNGLHVDQEPRQHPEGTGTSIQDMQVFRVTLN